MGQGGEGAAPGSGGQDALGTGGSGKPSPSGSAGETTAGKSGGDGGSLGKGTAGAGNEPAGAKSTPGGAPASGGSAPTADGPVFLSFSANVDTIGENASPLTVTAVVTDPDGIEDVIGGTLDDPETGKTYGAFATAAQEGSYTLTLSMNQINAVRAVNAPPAGVDLVFRATFFDATGHKATRDLTVTYSCASPNIPGMGCCGGHSVDFETNPYNCGSCGNACGDPSWSKGLAGACEGFRCISTLETETRQACGMACTAVDAECVLRQDNEGKPTVGTAYYDGVSMSLADCSAVPIPENLDWHKPFDYQFCECIWGEPPEWASEL